MVVRDFMQVILNKTSSMFISHLFSTTRELFLLGRGGRVAG